ncbi:MAG: DUF1697 domain-containing protein [Candidatus Saccharibacteria bacterium]|nr:DUF1697 domain-containing protein [Rhodoferax sp.]
MTSYVALLRGINVGKGNRVPMADLRALLYELGYSDVVTLLNSGNAVFCTSSAPSAAHAKRIALAITGKFGLDILVIVKSATEFSAVVQGNAQANATDHSQLFAVFAQEAEALGGLASLTPLVVPPRSLFYRPARCIPALRWWRSEKQGRSRAAGQSGPLNHHPQLGHHIKAAGAVASTCMSKLRKRYKALRSTQARTLWRLIKEPAPQCPLWRFARLQWI